MSVFFSEGCACVCVCVANICSITAHYCLQLEGHDTNQNNNVNMQICIELCILNMQNSTLYHPIQKKNKKTFSVYYCFSFNHTVFVTMSVQLTVEMLPYSKYICLPHSRRLNLQQMVHF